MSVDVASLATGFARWSLNCLCSVGVGGYACFVLPGPRQSSPSKAQRCLDVMLCGAADMTVAGHICVCLKGLPKSVCDLRSPPA